LFSGNKNKGPQKKKENTLQIDAFSTNYIQNRGGTTEENTRNGGK
jgi:hypothetical protein